MTLRFSLRRRKEEKTTPNLPMSDPQPAEEAVEDGHELQMGFFEHLDELRSRLIKVILGVVAGSALGMIVAQPVLEYLLEPYASRFPEEGRRLVVLGPTGAVVSYFRVALLVGGILAIPLITYQVLMFILPGLTRKEKRHLFTALPAITALFLVGVAFCWFVLIPPAIGFLEEFQRDIFSPEWTAENYLSFVTSLLFWMGVAFEAPLVFFVLAVLGIVTAGGLIRNWRFAVVGAALAAALITPTVDPVNMFLVMGPLLILYIISIILVIIGRRIAGLN